MTDNAGWKVEPHGRELVPLSDVRLVVDSVALGMLGGSPSFEQWSTAAERLKKVHGAVKFWIGDLLAMGESLFAEEASQVIDQSYLSEAEVKQYVYVAKGVTPTVRAHAPSWDHCKAVVGLKTEEQEEWLDKARAEDWPARKLSSEIASAKAGGKTVMRFWLVVECGTEARRDKLAGELTTRGFSIKKQEKLAKVKLAKRKKKEPVTAKKKRSGERPRNQRPKKA